MTRTRRKQLTFARAFTLAGVDHPLPAGAYEIITDEELIEGLNFPVYRRTATWIMARASSSGGKRWLRSIPPRSPRPIRTPKCDSVFPEGNHMVVWEYRIVRAEAVEAFEAALN